MPSFKVASAIRDRASGLLTGDPTRARALAEALVAGVERARTGAAARAVAFRARAEAGLYTGQLDAARADYARAVESAEAAGDDAPLGQILVGWIGLLAVVGERRAVKKLSERARRILERVHDDAYLAKLYMNLGTLAFSEERYADAREAYAKAGSMFETLGVRDGTWVSLLMNQALACTSLQRIDEARTLFVQTEDAASSLGLDRVYAQARFNRAHLERHLGDYRAAMALLDNAHARFQAQEITDMVAAVDRARAEIYLDLSMASDALDAAERATAAFGAIDMHLDAHLADLVAGKALLEMGKPRRALDLVRRAERHFSQSRIWPRRASSQLMIARAHVALGEPSAALATLRSALRTFRAHDMRRHASLACRLLAEVHLEHGRVANAARFIGAANRATRGLPPGERADLHALTARLARRRGDVAGARRHLTRAARCVEAQLDLIPGIELRARSFEHHVRVYHDLVDLTRRRRGASLGELFTLVERSRARGYRQRAHGRRSTRQDPLRSERATLGAITARIDELEYQKLGLERERALRSLRAEQRDLERRLTEAQHRDERHGDEPARSVVPSVEDVVSSLPRGCALVEYVVSREDILAFVFTRDGADLVVLEDARSRVLAAADSLRLQLDTLAVTARSPAVNLAFQRRASERHLGELYAALIRPLETILGRIDTLVFVPTRELHGVPFECLHDGHSYIDERWIVGRRPAVELGGRRARQPRTPSIFAAGTLRNGPSYVREEIESISRCAAGGTLDIVWDPTTQQIFDALERHDVVHVSAHGAFRDDNPWFSRISTGDGALFMADLLERRVTSKLVVLSACVSGHVLGSAGDDLSGVAHAFLVAGAGCLVASHWRVHDRATRDLMEAFYGALSASTAPRAVAAALSRARREVREEWPHPFYWGSFGIHGV